jgi:hypothetical protein
LTWRDLGAVVSSKILGKFSLDNYGFLDHGGGLEVRVLVLLIVRPTRVNTWTWCTLFKDRRRGHITFAETLVEGSTRKTAN